MKEIKTSLYNSKNAFNYILGLSMMQIEQFLMIFWPNNKCQFLLNVKLKT